VISKYLVSSLNEWVVPSHWSVIPLKHMCSASALYGLNESSESYSETGVRFLRTTDITEEGTLNNNPVFLDADKVSGYLLSNRDLLISRSGTVGRCYIYDDHIGPCAYAGYLVRFVLKEEHNPWFVYYVTKSLPFMKWLSLSSIEATIGNVNGEKFANAPIPVPPQKEQDRIVHFLKSKTNEIDTLIAAKQRLLNLLTEKRRTLITQAVTKGLDTSVEMKDSGIPWLGEIPAHWSMVTLRRLITSLEQGWSPVASNQSANINEFGVLKLSAVKSGRLIYEENKALASDADIPTGLFIREGDIFLTRANTPKFVGDVAIAKSDHNNLIFSDLIYRLRVRFDKVEPEWLILVLQSVIGRGQIEAEAKGSSNSMVKLAQDQVLGLLITNPSKAEQKTIIEYVQKETEKLANLIFATERTIKLLQERRAALISAAVTGKITIESMNLITESSHAN